MTFVPPRWIAVAAAILTISIGARQSCAISADNVLVVYNSAIPDGKQIAQYYASQHPGVRLLGIKNLPAGEQITQSQYRSIVRPQVQAGLDPSIDVIVTTKGMPLRIYNDKTPSAFPYNYTDSQGIARTIYSTSYKPYSSLESELTRVDTISTWVQMGDQTWWSPNSAAPNQSANPYFGKSARFSHVDPAMGQLRLSTRLDGYTVADVKGSIDRAKNAYVVRFGQQVILDDSPSATAAGMTSMPGLAGNVLPRRGQSFVYDTQVAPVLSASKPVIGYVSHGTNDGSGQLPADYMRSKLRFNLARGAIAQTWESYNGYSFTDGPHRNGQGSIADWISAGGTGGIAQVEEPGGSLWNMTNESRMFDLMLKGYTFAEAAWAATPQVSYVNTVIGDPLMVWRKWIAGDANLDGKVDLKDFVVLKANWLKPGTFDTGDFNGDSVVNATDLSILKAQMYRQSGPLFGSNITAGDVDFSSVPEPAFCLLATFTILLRPRRRSPD